MNVWEECYRDHFAKYLGKPFDLQQFRHQDHIALKLATYDLGLPGYRVYASLGLAEYVDQLKDLGEVVLLADDKGQDIPRIFLHALFFIVEHNIPLGSRFAIGGLEVLNPGFAEHFQKTALFFTLAMGLPAGFETVEGWEETGLVFQAIFLTKEEHDYLNRAGAAALEERLQVQAMQSLRRPSCV